MTTGDPLFPCGKHYWFARDNDNGLCPSCKISDQLNSPLLGEGFFQPYIPLVISNALDELTKLSEEFGGYEELYRNKSDSFSDEWDSWISNSLDKISK